MMPQQIVCIGILPKHARACLGLAVLSLFGLAVTSCIRSKPSQREIPSSAFDSATPIKVDKNDRSCGGFPAAPIETMESVCMGLVFQSESSSFQPRAISEIPGHPGKFLVTDFSGWSTTAGKIWIVDASKGAGAVTTKVFLQGLSIVHQIIPGPNDRMYFSEDHQISSFPIALAQSGQTIEREQTTAVIGNLPPMLRGSKKNSMHPIKHFVFDSEGSLIVNIGAYTDHCNDFRGRACEETDTAIGDGTSNDVKDHGGVLRRYQYLGSAEKGWSKDYRLVAQGLRNSMGLLLTTKGDLLQAENGRDFNDSARPFEELNVVPKAVLEGSEKPRHYGWPYCYNHDETSEEWQSFGFSCNPDSKNYTAPFSLLPPHSAPLGMTLYTGQLMPSLQSKLIVPLHGYRPAGHRILAIDINPDTGLPEQRKGGVYFVDDLSGASQNLQRSYPENGNVAPASEVVSGWYDAPGVRGKGAPVAITQGSDGAIWIADDKNSAILRLAAPSDGFSRHNPPPRPNFAKAYSELIAESPKWMASYQHLKSKVLQSEQCRGCHDDYRNPGDDTNDGLAELRYIASFGNWVVAADTEKSVLFQKLSPPGKSSMPPKDKPFKTLEEAQAALQMTNNLIEAMPPLKAIFVVKAGATPTVVGLRRGQGGNRDCGKLKEGQAVWVLGQNSAQLRGVAVREVLIGPESQIVDRNSCKDDNAFYVTAADLEPFIR